MEKENLVPETEETEATVSEAEPEVAEETTADEIMADAAPEAAEEEAEATAPEAEPEVAEETTADEITADAAPEAAEEEAEATAPEAEAEVAEETTDDEINEDAAPEAAEETAEEAAENCGCEECGCCCEEEENEEEPKNDGIAPGYCKRCGINRINENEEYCEVCSKALKKTRLPFIGALVALAILGASFFAFVMTLLFAAPALQVFKGDLYAKKKCWYSAYEAYSDLDTVISEISETMNGADLSQLLKSGSGFKVKMVDTIAHAYSPIEAVQYSSNIFDTAATAYAEKNKTYLKHKEFYDEYNNTYTGISEALVTLQTEENPDCDKTIAELEACRGQEGVNDVFLDYFIYNVAGYCGADKETVYTYLQKLDETAKASGKDYSWLYYSETASALLSLDKGEDAIPYLDTLLENDRSNSTAAQLKLKILISLDKAEEAEDLIDTFEEDNEGETDASALMRVILFRCTGKYDEAKELATSALEDYPTVAELYRQLALIALIEGDYSAAFDNAYEAENTAYYLYSYYGDSSQYTSELTATSYVCTCLAHNSGKYDGEYTDDLDEIYESYAEYDLCESAVKVVKGELKPADVLTKGAYDFT